MHTARWIITIKAACICILSWHFVWWIIQGYVDADTEFMCKVS